MCRWAFCIACALALHVLLAAPAAHAQALLSGPPLDTTLDIVHEGYDPTVNAPGTTWRPVRGIYRLSLTYEEFFATVGRKDLAEQISQRHRTGQLVAGLGWVGILAGGAGLLWGLDRDSTPIAGAGLALLLGGIVTRSVGVSMSDTRNPVPESVARDMAARYNDWLRGPQNAPGNAPPRPYSPGTLAFAGRF